MGGDVAMMNFFIHFVRASLTCLGANTRHLVQINIPALSSLSQCYAGSLDFVTNDLKENHSNVFFFDVDGERKALVPPGFSKTPARSNSLSGLPEKFSKRDLSVDISKNKSLFLAIVSL